jgi:hypothetical protein
MKIMKALLFIISLVVSINLNGQENKMVRKIPTVEIFGKYEINIENKTSYINPFFDTQLLIELKSPDGRVLKHFGFYDGAEGWKIRFSPDEPGRWEYTCMFTEYKTTQEGAFFCIDNNLGKGKIGKNKYNSFWMGRGFERKTQFRSFHVGDRFFAFNWDDPENQNDGNKRTLFLDWLQNNKYNMLSVASFFTNRNEEGRGKGWDTPSLWPINPDEYRKMEIILDELNERNITVFPFSGFFGANADWPVNIEEQEIYIKYVLARFGHYPNLIFNVAGPEPFWREDSIFFKGAMRFHDILRLGSLIDSLDVHNHLITVHNEKRASQYGDPFINEAWCDISTLQGPTTTNLDELYSGLSVNHIRNKICYAQETLWAGNKNQPDYSLKDIRLNTLAILFSGSILNFADMNGNSSSGFSGSMELSDCNQDLHDEVNRVWDWFESIPFHQLIARQDLVRNGFCLANEGQEYYIFSDRLEKFEVFLDFPYFFQVEWINANNFSDVRKGQPVNKKTLFSPPEKGTEWILHLVAPQPDVVATGNFPDIASDIYGNIHIAYNREGLKYKKYNAAIKEWEHEVDLECPCENVKRSDPDIVVDSNGRPYIYCGKEFTWFDGTKWKKNIPGSNRDTELAIDSEDNIFLVHRGGNNGGHIGLLMKSFDQEVWKQLTDPDKDNFGSNDHVYPDIFIDKNDKIHLVQRHGPEVEVTYRTSIDKGINWIKESVVNQRAEGPHLIADSKGNPIITTGNGIILERSTDSKWNTIGRKIHVFSRMQPEIGIDNNDNIYVTAFGGKYVTRLNKVWLDERVIEPVTDFNTIGFVETSGAEDFSYIIWEEGNGNPDEGLDENSKIIVGILYPDGRIIGLF